MKLMMDEYERALKYFFSLRFEKLNNCGCKNVREPNLRNISVAGNLIKVQTRCMACGNLENMVITCTGSLENASSYQEILILLGASQTKSTPVVTNFSSRQRNFSKKLEKVNSDSAKNYDIIQGFKKAFG